MDLDGLFAIVGFILHWRVALCLIGSSTLAFVLVQAFPWLSGLQGIALALLGLLPGAIWEAQETTLQSAPDSAPRKTTSGVAGASAIIAGATWGAFSASSAHSFFAGVVIFTLAAWGWFRYASATQPRIPIERVYLCTALAAVAYPVAAALAHNALFQETHSK